MRPFIEVKGLAKRYKGHSVLEDCSLSIKEGEIVVIQGPSGVGKSTLLRCLTYLDPFDAGKIRVGDVEVHAGMNERKDYKTILALREQLGFVFQFFHLFPHLTIQQNLTVGPVHVLREPEEQARAQAMTLLKRIGLEDKADAYPASLSGGQAQRVAIARALAMHPKGLLLDEPTSSLDPAMKKDVIKVLKEFSHDKLTMVIVTHEPHVAEAIATRVLHCGPGGSMRADAS